MPSLHPNCSCFARTKDLVNKLATNLIMLFPFLPIVPQYRMTESVTAECQQLGERAGISALYLRIRGQI
jgi:hypothetical protein